MYSYLTSQMRFGELDVSSSWFKQYLELLDKSKDGLSIPTRIDPARWDLECRVSKLRRWPAILDFAGTCLIVSGAIVELFKEHAGADIQVFPMRVRKPRGSPLAPEYFFINVLHQEDACNLTRSRVYLSEYFSRPLELESCVILKHTVIDAARLSQPRQLFALRYFSFLIFGPRLTRALSKLKSREFKLNRVRNTPEDSAERAETLRRLGAELEVRNQALAAKPTIQTTDALEEFLKVELPTAARKYFTDLPDIEDCATELFDLSRAAEETQRLREWKELQWPVQLVCISDDGRGGYWALDTSKAKAGDCPVVYFDHELADVDRKTGAITPNLELAAPTLRAWLKGLKAGGTGLPESEPKGRKAASKKVRKKAKTKGKKK